MKNWFNLLLVGFIIFVIQRKDFNFQFDFELNDKEKSEKELVKLALPVKLNTNYSLLEKPKINKVASDSMQLKKSLKKRSSKNLVDHFKNIDKETKVAFIRRFGHVAINERRKYGIPSSLILANGLLISQAGTREISQNGNSFFALPCSTDWLGEKGFDGSRCVRFYDNAWTSFRDHSLFLTTGTLAPLKAAIQPNDYVTWAKALQQADFYETPDLDKHIISTVEEFKLQQFDSD